MTDRPSAPVADLPVSAPPMPGHDAWMAAATEEQVRLVRLLGGLSPEQWAAPTVCDGWAVRDIVAHLVGAAASEASPVELVRLALAARKERRVGDLIDRINDVQVRERQEHSPAQLLADLETIGRRALRARRRLPAALRAIRLPFGPPLGIRPLGYLMDCIYTRDAWMHRVDICDATGTHLELDRAHDGAIVADLVAEWLRSHGSDVDLTLTGPAGGHWSVGSDGDRITMDAVQFARVLSGRAPGTGLLTTRVPF